MLMLTSSPSGDSHESGSRPVAGVGCDDGLAERCPAARYPLTDTDGVVLGGVPGRANDTVLVGSSGAVAGPKSGDPALPESPLTARRGGADEDGGDGGPFTSLLLTARANPRARPVPPTRLNESGIDDGSAASDTAFSVAPRCGAAGSRGDGCGGSVALRRRGSSTRCTATHVRRLKGRHRSSRRRYVVSSTSCFTDDAEDLRPPPRVLSSALATLTAMPSAHRRSLKLPCSPRTALHASHTFCCCRAPGARSGNNDDGRSTFFVQHCLQKSSPHERQWCRRTVTVNGARQLKHPSRSPSGIHTSRSAWRIAALLSRDLTLPIEMNLSGIRTRGRRQ
mmetsp:Transcript_13967/g.43503  ORF Transcript_13967/g.43503 Transcript_13967/m.43503 type:complete len:337 (+) Transcript_13967:460-1470(+)